MTRYGWGMDALAFLVLAVVALWFGWAITEAVQVYAETLAHEAAAADLEAEWLSQQARR